MIYYKKIEANGVYKDKWVLNPEKKDGYMPIGSLPFAEYIFKNVYKKGVVKTHNGEILQTISELREYYKKHSNKKIRWE